jgi:hypothetical protein
VRDLWVAGGIERGGRERYCNPWQELQIRPSGPSSNINSFKNPDRNQEHTQWFQPIPENIVVNSDFESGASQKKVKYQL